MYGCFGSKPAERFRRKELQVFASAHSGAAIPVTANSGHLTVPGRASEKGRQEPSAQVRTNGRHGGDETFFVIRPVDPSKMVPKLAGV